MSPRPYRLGRREAATEETRSRVLAATRALLAAPGGLGDFSMEAVARQANVARMTVYYQFGSRRGLLEALFDDLAIRGRLAEHLAATFQRPEPLEALRQLIAAFVEFWATDRIVTRRVRSLAALDPEFEQAIQNRDQRRRQIALSILGRLVERFGHPAPEELEQAADTLDVLTSFETYDRLAGEKRAAAEVTESLYHMALAVIGLGQLLSSISQA
jgi:AcrR family transcriptional regulator